MLRLSRHLFEGSLTGTLVIRALPRAYSSGQFFGEVPRFFIQEPDYETSGGFFSGLYLGSGTSDFLVRFCIIS